MDDIQKAERSLKFISLAKTKTVENKIQWKRQDDGYKCHIETSFVELSRFESGEDYRYHLTVDCPGQSLIKESGRSVTDAGQVMEELFFIVEAQVMGSEADAVESLIEKMEKL